jgi:hypothetical protein
MSKRFDNKRILYILAGLMVVLALTILIKIPKERATLKDKLIELDTANVYKIIFQPRGKEEDSFEFIKNKGKWNVQQNKIVSTPEKDAVENILQEVQNIRPKSLEAVDKSRWKDFNLTDSLATRVQLMNEKGKILADLMIGKFTYNPVNDPYSRSDPNSVQGTSFVRLYNEKKVYGVDGFLSFSFSGKFDDYRDKSFLKLKREDVTKISFVMPADSSFILKKKDSVWHAGDRVCDSLSIANYLNAISYLNGQDFRDNFKPVVNPLCDLLIEGNNLLNISVKCYSGEGENEYILNSSLNPDVYFSSKKDGLFEKLFKSEKYFLTKSATK